MLATHPTLQELNDYAAGRLPDQESQEVESHLDHCEACQETLFRQSPEYEWLVRKLRRLPITNQPELDPGCERLVQSVQDISRADLARQLASVSDEPGCVGQRIRDYELVEWLGRGGMGEVYKARHVLTNRIRAIKLIVPERLQRDGARERFIREMQAGTDLPEHSHVTRMFEAGEFDGRLFLVMEYLDGVDLGRIAKQWGQLPIPEACEIARQAASGIHHIHNSNFVHRDIKPSNLLLTRQGKVKLLDLGLARLNDHQVEGLTSSGQVLGSIDYMAPEQAQDSSEVDIRADLYSLGATLYMLLAGQPPFGNLSKSNLLKKLVAIATISEPPLRNLRPDVPDAVAELVHRLLSKSPEDRPSNPQDVAAELEPFTAGHQLNKFAEQMFNTSEELRRKKEKPIKPAGYVLGDQSRKPPLRRRWAMALSALMFIAVIAAGIIYPSRPPIDPLLDSAGIVLRFDRPPSDSDLQSLRNHLSLRRIDFGDRPIFNAKLALEVAATLPRLTHLRLNGITLRESSDFDALAECKNLEELVILDARSLVDEKMWIVRNMKRLRRLDLPNSHVSGEGLQHLHPDARLISLNMYKTYLSNDNWVDLPVLANLEELNVGYCDMGEVLLRFGNFAQLKRLNLKECDLAKRPDDPALDPAYAQAVMDVIVSLRLLESLELENTFIDDVQIRRLAILPRLRFLDLEGTQLISKETDQILRREMPHCLITSFIPNLE